MPYGGTTPEQDKKIERCVNDLVAKGKKKGNAIAICKSSIMKKEGFVLENVPLKFTAQIKEMVKLEEGAKRKATGTLLVNTTSRNGVTYEIEEINTATYGGFPYSEGVELTASLNHTDDVTDNIAVWKPVPRNGEIGYEATVFNTGKHPYVTDMMDKGLIKYVSVEAIAKNLIESSGKRIAKGLDIVGMGFVKTPGVKEVSLAIEEAFDSYKSEELEVSPEEIKFEERQTGEMMETKEEKKSDPVLEAVTKLIEKLDKTSELEKKVEDLTKKMEEKKETKGIVTETTQKPAPRFKMVREKNKRYPGTIDIYAEGINY